MNTWNKWNKWTKPIFLYLNPQISYKIYQSYVIPRLLYGMEILPLNQSQLDIMIRFHTKTLRNIQSLPTRTATGSVFMLLGALTIEAEIHKRQLSFLYSVLSCNNSTIQGLVDRQIIMNIDNHLSFFCKVTGVLALYDLPSITTLSQNLPSKLKWKATVKFAIQDYWTKTLIKEIETKSSLTYLDKTLLRIGSTHPVWTSLSSTVLDVKMGAIKVRLLTGTYLLESHRSKFSGGRESALFGYVRDHEPVELQPTKQRPTPRPRASKQQKIPAVQATKEESADDTASTISEDSEVTSLSGDDQIEETEPIESASEDAENISPEDTTIDDDDVPQDANELSAVELRRSGREQRPPAWFRSGQLETSMAVAGPTNIPEWRQKSEYILSLAQTPLFKATGLERDAARTILDIVNHH
ncbi:unnamed protein product [Mytilus coruscus]|uniref:Uncharacterized protein n=1 Tax=Mytilus coruscus TaxID=42192 RepID=A0A6J8CFT5_MYTCO|nr:unnamed protein product [Mytilus coruscus]